MRMISTPDAPSPAGHYSQAVVYGDTVYVSGQLAVNPVTGEKGVGSIEEQTRLTLRNIEQILLSAGSDLDHVVKTTAYVSDVELWGGVNQAYAEVFGDHRPARVVVPSRDLHYGCLVEIEAIAALR
ncbi:MAG: RidA family protein [marine benthic group bacterium]|jgi:2-iminobutanoate/2-iminopropanoate deaminase|nr:RidA family protein [Gemmatimonadota bacterium]